MKYVLAVAAVAALFSAATLPAQAIAPCPTTTTYATNPLLPPECALPETQVKHPKWYREGGYCGGGAGLASSNIGSQHAHCGKF